MKLSFYTLFNNVHYTPHGFCLFWDPSLLTLFILGHGIIALAYFLIPAFILYGTVKLRLNIPRWILFEFAAFIFTCGIAHILEIVDLFYTAYYFEGIWLNFCGFISILTAFTLPVGIMNMLRQQRDDLEAKTDSMAKDKVRKLIKNVVDTDIK